MRRGHETRGLWALPALESVETVIDEGARQLPGPVGSEVHEQHRVTVPNRCRIADARGGNEFIAFVPRIGLVEGLCGAVRRVLRLARREQVVDGLHAVPALVPIHRKIASGHRRDAPGPDLGEAVFRGFEGRGRAAGRRVAPVEEGVEVDRAGAAPRREAQGGKNLSLVTVHTAR